MDNISIGTIIIWLIIGSLAGSLAGRVVTRSKKGYGFIGNLILGLVGAVVGGFIFNLLDINIGAEIVISLGDLIAAFVGAVLLIIVLGFFRR